MYNRKVNQTVFNKVAKGQIPVDPAGYWNSENWGKPVIIPSNTVTGIGINQPLIGIDNLGTVKPIFPGQPLIKFRGDIVMELPIIPKKQVDSGWAVNSTGIGKPIPWPMTDSGRPSASYYNRMRGLAPGLFINGGEMELTDEEIEEYKRDGYIVEYLDDPSIPKLPKAQMGVIGQQGNERKGNVYPFLSYRAGDSYPTAGVKYNIGFPTRDTRLQHSLGTGIYGSPEKIGTDLIYSSKYREPNKPFNALFDLYGGYGTDQGFYTGVGAYPMFNIVDRKDASFSAGPYLGYEMQTKLPQGIVNTMQSTGDVYFADPQSLPLGLRLPLSSGFRYGVGAQGNIGNFYGKGKFWFDPVQGKLSDPDSDNPIIKTYQEKVGTDQVHFKPSFEISAGYNIPIDAGKSKIKKQIEERKAREKFEEELNKVRDLESKNENGDQEFVRDMDLKNKILNSENKRYRFQEGGYIDLELTPEEIEQYVKGGYIVEELPKAQEGIYVYSGRPEAKYKKDRDGNWLISLPSTRGQFIPIEDPTGSRTQVLNKHAILDLDTPSKMREKIRKLDESIATLDAYKYEIDPLEFTTNFSESTNVNLPNYSNVNLRDMMEQQDARVRFNESKKFISDWHNSPMYKSMIKESAPETEDYYTIGRKNNLKSMGALRFGKQAESGETTGGFSDNNDGGITLLPHGKDVQGIMRHEISHSSDRPYYWDNRFNNWFTDKPTGRLIPESDVDFINKAKVRSLEESGIQDGNEWINYVSEPTEVRARLMDIRGAAKKMNIYDPFTEEVTPEIYEKLKDTDFEVAPGKSGFDPLYQLRGVFKDDDIIKMLNTISDADIPASSNNQSQAKFGGFLPKAQKGKATSSENLVPNLNINQPFSSPQQSNFYKYGFINPGPKEFSGGLGFGFPKAGFEISARGVTPYNVINNPYFKGNYSVDLNKTLGDFRLNLGLKTPVYRENPQEGFKVNLQPSAKLIYNVPTKKKSSQLPKAQEGVYVYSGRPEAKYKKDENGNWLINLPSTKGKYIPIKDPTGSRTQVLNKQARLESDIYNNELYSQAKNIYDTERKRLLNERRSMIFSEDPYAIASVDQPILTPQYDRFGNVTGRTDNTAYTRNLNAISDYHKVEEDLQPLEDKTDAIKHLATMTPQLTTDQKKEILSNPEKLNNYMQAYAEYEEAPMGSSGGGDGYHTQGVLKSIEYDSEGKPYVQGGIDPQSTSGRVNMLDKQWIKGTLGLIAAPAAWQTLGSAMNYSLADAGLLSTEGIGSSLNLGNVFTGMGVNDVVTKIAPDAYDQVVDMTQHGLTRDNLLGLGKDIIEGGTKLLSGSKLLNDVGILSKAPNITNLNAYKTGKNFYAQGKYGSRVVGDELSDEPYNIKDNMKFIKSLAPFMKKQEGGSIDLELSPEEIQWYIDNGYVVEEI